MVLQAFAWEHLCNPWPSCAPFPSYAQMRAQRDLVLENSHPRLILWYSYFELLKSDNPNKHWTDLVAAAGADSKPSAPLFSVAPPCYINTLVILTHLSEITLDLYHC